MSTVFAVFLAGMFALAALTKLRDLKGTRAGFVNLGLPMPDVLVWAVPVVELAVAIMLLVAPGWGGVAAFALLLAFTVVLVTTITSGRLVPCRCFGGLSDEPVSWVQVARNGWLLVIAAVASLEDALGRPPLAQLVVAVMFLGVGMISIGWADRRLRVEA